MAFNKDDSKKPGSAKLESVCLEAPRTPRKREVHCIVGRWILLEVLLEVLLEILLESYVENLQVQCTLFFSGEVRGIKSAAS